MPRRNVISSMSDSSSQPLRPALTPEARENQLISLAYDLAEKRLREGTASSAEVVHFLKYGSQKERLERQILESQKDLYVAKTESIKAERRIESLYEDALAAMKTYTGSVSPFKKGDDPEDEQNY